ncbi:MAG: 4Fe-4S binding protein [Bacteroidota bacterium]
MKVLKERGINILIVLFSILLPGFICQFFQEEPISRKIHVSSFRYGKDPSVIRCNRGDTLILTFSSEDTGHSFFLEEFDIDVKVSPASETVYVFRTSDPTIKPELAEEVTLIARHPGILNYLIAKSNYRCHVWCGPMHAFEQGKLIIMPNTLLASGLGGITGILIIWILLIFRYNTEKNQVNGTKRSSTDLLGTSAVRNFVKSRWPQMIVMLLAMVMIYIVILTSVFGTKMSGRNLGVLLMWAVWLFLLVALMTPFLGRIWCTICPLPFFGDLLQRRSFFNPAKGKTGNYNNRFFGSFMKWPEFLSNSWLKLIIFMILATFSTTLVATPKVSGITVLMLMVVPTIMSVIWGLKAFCRYVCPVSVFVGPFSRMSFIALRNKDQLTCDQCRQNFCEKGNLNGWACPYGLNVGKINENSDCGLCLECLRTCSYNNITIYRVPFASETGTRNLSEAWISIAIFTISIVYSILYLGHWSDVRDYVNILDKKNWDLFGIYSAVIWTFSLGIIPGLLYLLAGIGSLLTKASVNVKKLFLDYAGAILPLGMMIWIAFVIPMFFNNTTFIIQSVSDPFGWGWDFFGTANIPWHQFLPRLVPWLQALMVLTGYYLSLRNLLRHRTNASVSKRDLSVMVLPIAVFITTAASLMLVFFTN